MATSFDYLSKDEISSTVREGGGLSEKVTFVLRPEGVGGASQKEKHILGSEMGEIW